MSATGQPEPADLGRVRRFSRGWANKLLTGPEFDGVRAYLDGRPDLSTAIIEAVQGRLAEAEEIARRARQEHDDLVAHAKALETALDGAVQDRRIAYMQISELQAASAEACTRAEQLEAALAKASARESMSANELARMQAHMHADARDREEIIKEVNALRAVVTEARGREKMLQEALEHTETRLMTEIRARDERLGEARAREAALTDALARAAAEKSRRRPVRATSDVGRADLRPDPGTAKTPAELMTALREFRIWAGNPSYRVMAQRSGHRAAASTMCTLLKNDELPERLEVIEAVIEGCGGSAEDRQRFATAWRHLAMKDRVTAEIGTAAGKAEPPHRPTPLRAVLAGRRPDKDDRPRPALHPVEAPVKSVSPGAM